MEQQVKGSAPKQIKETNKLKLRLVLGEVKTKTINKDTITYPALYEVTNPNKVGLFEANREIKSDHVKTMTSSVMSMNKVLRYPLIIKIGKRYVWGDGQHLQQALTNLGAKMICAVIEAKDEIDALFIITKMNKSSRNWTVGQFIISWAKYRNSYQILLDFKKRYKVNYQVIASLLTGLKPSKASELIQDGKFEAYEMQKGERRIQAIDNFHQKTKFRYTSYCSHGLISFMDWIGYVEYFKNERKFLEMAIILGAKKNYDTKILGDKDSYIEFFKECYFAIPKL